MVFLSVVPDSFYFVWQIELQLYNFKKFGIGREDIHILIAADEKYGLSIWFTEFVEQNRNDASFYIYSRPVDQFKYQPSIRPHLLKQHFDRLPWLQKEVIFYHDSDIIFRELPDFDSLSRGDEWYVADCRSYMDSGYIKGKGSGIFDEMCSLLDIDPALVEKNDIHTGGAQYILKGVSAGFWESMEKDCERLYPFLQSQEMAAATGSKGIQSWCTDMWVLFWTGLKMGKTIRISQELNFCWAGDPIGKYATVKIFHNSGAGVLGDADQPAIFNKALFTAHSPYYFSKEQYSKERCAYEFVQLIQEFEDTRIKEDLQDVTFLMPVYIDSADRLLNLEITARYLHKYFKTRIIIVEAGKVPKVSPSLLPPNAEYRFIEDEGLYFHRTRYNNLMVKLSSTKYVALYDVDVILPPSQIIGAVRALREEKAYISYPYSGTFYSTTVWVKDLFRMTLDHSILARFTDNYPCGTKRSLGGCVFLERATFIANGGENEYLTSWGPDDVERAARYKILGYRIHRTPGDLYHLPHERGVNSDYHQSTYHKLMREYLFVCSRSKTELFQYIQSWDFYGSKDNYSSAV